MLELYTYGTSNGQRASVMLEECGQQYKAIKVDLERGEQKTPNFLRINPAGQIPVLVDLSRAGGKPIVICQSGAIILHLAERTGRLLPRDPTRRQLAYQWFMQSMTDVALYPTVSFRREIIAQSGELPYLMRWLATMDARPAVQRGMAIPGD